MIATATPGRLRTATHRSPARPAARAAAGLLALAAMAAVTAPRCAPAAPLDLSVGALAGSVVLDPHLADYRWESGAHAAWGALARVQAGPLHVGARAWRSATTQSLGIPGDDRALDVRLTGADLSAEFPVAGAAGFALAATASAGLLHVGYSPDALELPDGGAGTTVVGFAPITAPAWGLGAGMHRALGSRLAATASLGRTWFRMDTSHRDGDSIVSRSETFGHWMAQLTLTHRIWGGAR
jgi:hypothetical protein